MFEKFGVFTKGELESRVEVLYEQYSNTINIEGLATLDIAKKQIVPAVMKYQRKLANGVAELKTVGIASTMLLKFGSPLLSASATHSSEYPLPLKITL